MTNIVSALPEGAEDFLQKCAAAAGAGGHVWPDFAACEAALESNYGRSTLAAQDNNLFGMKQHKHPVFGTVALPTGEFLNGQWVRVTADFVKYPGWAECLGDRMSTLRRLAPVKGFEHYAAALSALTGGDFVREVSKSWSTDPNRAQKVIDIYSRWKSL
jgi:flagellum-specific peptidoglycan hydrolase FlgJ